MAVTRAEMFNDHVSTPQQREEDVDRSEHRRRSNGNAHRILHSESDISHAVEDFRARLASLGWCDDRAQIIKELFDQAERCGIFVDPVPSKAHWYMDQVENHAGYPRMMGNRTMEDLGIDEEYVQQLLDEVLAAKKLVQHNGYLPRHYVLGSSPRVSGHVLDDNPDLPLLVQECRFRKKAQCGQICRMAAIEVEVTRRSERA